MNKDILWLKDNETVLCHSCKKPMYQDEIAYWDNDLIFCPSCALYAITYEKMKKWNDKRKD